MNFGGRGAGGRGLDICDGVDGHTLETELTETEGDNGGSGKGSAFLFLSGLGLCHGVPCSSCTCNAVINKRKYILAKNNTYEVVIFRVFKNVQTLCDILVVDATE